MNIGSLLKIPARILTGTYRLATSLLALIGGIAIFSGLVTIIIYIFFARGLPDIHSIEDYHPPVISEVFARDGTRIGEFWTECRMFVPYDQIPTRILQAFIDSEDDRFFEHKGIDMRAILRAFVANVRSGNISQGGSTITQQVTRALLLSPERTFYRKIREAILATRLERTLTKEQILTLYVNQIFLGNRAYGIKAAARNYFHKDLDQLTLGEITLIAGLPTAPARYAPTVNPSAARLRQEHVLNRMFQHGHITQTEMEAAYQEPLTVYVAGLDKDAFDDDAAWFVEHVRRLMKERYGDEALYHQGLKIQTTLDLKLQRLARASLLDGIRRLEMRQGFRGPLRHVESEDIPETITTMDVQLRSQQDRATILWPPERATTPRPLSIENNRLYEAIVTGFDGNQVIIAMGSAEGRISHDGYKWARRFNTEVTGYDDGNYVTEPRRILKVGDIISVRQRPDSTFDLTQEPKVEGAFSAIDPHTGDVVAMVGGTDFRKSEFNRATQSLRQTGSSFKPFVYAAALDKGYTFRTTIVDEPMTYQVGEKMFWSPKNYGNEYKGATSFADALVFSRNLPTVKITYDIGTHYLTGYVRKCGITSPIDKYLSMALGANGAYLSELVNAYAVFANGGILHEPRFISRVEDHRGNILEESSPQHSLPSPELSTPEAAQQSDTADAVRQAIAKVQLSDLNAELFAREQGTLGKDKLILTDLELKTLYGSAIPLGHVMTPQTAYLMTQLLKDVATRGTAWRVRELGKPAAGKTGTTNDETDAWFIGFVPDLVAGVWVGFDEPKPIGKGETGGKTAVPIFLSFMKQATEGWEAKDFAKPADFPSGELSQLAGGSALFGARPQANALGQGGTADRAGEFFERDFESSELPAEEF
ncbi:MAG: PBP1A family penicillin-binding protein [Deltaproteobacteria bacterium]|nr:PBP1A family penicillin-binding protein [Deltaproteobacteria bacterium]